MSKETGGPAYPEIEKVWNSAHASYHEQYNSGMTLRDYFAGQALLGAINNRKDFKGKELGFDGFARYSYLMADAILKERDK